MPLNKFTLSSFVQHALIPLEIGCAIRTGVTTRWRVDVVGWRMEDYGNRSPPLSRFYLEIIELDCDWLDEVVAALS